MDGGRIVQCGTAREIIANPVSDYVAEFVAHMNPLDVLTAEDVMEWGDAVGPEIAPKTPIRGVMAALKAGSETLVVTENGSKLGVIHAKNVLGRLLDPRHG